MTFSYVGFLQFIILKSALQIYSSLVLKGQLISKGIFGVIVSTKKPTKLDFFPTFKKRSGNFDLPKYERKYLRVK